MANSAFMKLESAVAATAFGAALSFALIAPSTSTEAMPAHASKAAAPLIDTLKCSERRQSSGALDVAIIDFRGPIEAQFDSDGVYALLNTIAGSPSIGAVIVRIDSAGGDSYSSKKLYQALRTLKSACRLPMASFIGNVGTSGAFWIASAADEIYADPLSTVGGVGVVAVYANEQDKLARDGIHQTVIRTGDHKWPMMPYLPVDKLDVEKIKASLNLVLDEFVSALFEARKGKLKLERAQLVTGEAWMGREAYQLGLIDGPDSVDAVAARLVNGQPTSYLMFNLQTNGTPAELPKPPALLSKYSSGG